ncbi:unnamed protein product [Closterium sp. NIES-65]|nr:unnamed protein product [Closterium sp. NIES-65]
MGANAAAATDVVRLYVRMGTVMLLGSLAQPRKVRFEFERCVSVGTVMPEVASASGGGGGAVDALLLWDVFLGDALFERTVCDAVQLFASPDCSGTAAAEYQNTVYHTRDMSAFKMDASVKSIRCVLFMPLPPFFPPCLSPHSFFHASPPILSPILLPPCHFLPSHPSHPFLPWDPDDICNRVKCPEHSTCIKTNDSMEVACQCAQGYRNVYGKCKPEEPSTELCANRPFSSVAQLFLLLSPSPSLCPLFPSLLPSSPTIHPCANYAFSPCLLHAEPSSATALPRAMAQTLKPLQCCTGP